MDHSLATRYPDAVPGAGQLLRPSRTISCLLCISLALVASCARMLEKLDTAVHYYQLYPFAKKSCSRTLVTEVDGVTLTVHYPESVTEETARRFASRVLVAHRNLRHDWEVLLAGLRKYLGEAWFAKIKHAEWLQPPDEKLETREWYLIVGLPSTKPLIWNSPDNADYHILPSKSGPYTDEELTPQWSLDSRVHSLVHYILAELTESKRTALPRWIEEGIADYVAMQFQRWKGKRWDTGRELLARLTWQRPAVRCRLPHWLHSGGGPLWGFVGYLQDFRSTSWEDDLRYKGSLGLVLGLQSELGPDGLLDLIHELIRRAPKKGREVLQVVEARTGKPLNEVGLMPAEARSQLLESLLSQCAGACKRGRADSGGLPWAALGHFPEARERVVPCLQALAECEKPEVAREGLKGLMYLLEPELVAEELEKLKLQHKVSLEELPLPMLEEFAYTRKSKRRLRKWARWDQGCN